MHSRLETFSQFGEDALVMGYFRTKNTNRPGGVFEVPAAGFYVDIGAHHPIFISNTWALYERGWRGINVEPTPGLFEALQAERPRDVNLQMAISGQDGEATFYSYGMNVNNTLDAGRVDEARLQDRLTVQTLRLSTLLDRYLPPDTKVDFLSVDVEGLDLEVLQSNDWRRYRPEIVVAEQHGGGIEEQIQTPLYRFMFQTGYRMIGWAPPSLVFRDLAGR
jgi:FkbM family methyltransferase